MKREVGVELFRSGTRERSVTLNYHDSKKGGDGLAAAYTLSSLCSL